MSPRGPQNSTTARLTTLLWKRSKESDFDGIGWPAKSGMHEIIKLHIRRGVRIVHQIQPPPAIITVAGRHPTLGSAQGHLVSIVTGILHSQIGSGIFLLFSRNSRGNLNLWKFPDHRGFDHLQTFRIQRLKPNFLSNSISLCLTIIAYQQSN